MSISRRRFVSTLAAAGAVTPLASHARRRPDLEDLRAYRPHPGDLIPGPAFRHGVASGDPLADRVIVWTRVTTRSRRTLRVGWRLASDPLMQTIVQQGEARTGPSRDFTVKVDVTGLSPDQTYYYQFIANNESSPIGRTRTLPVGAVDKVRLAVCSCSNFAFGFFSAYGHIAARADLNGFMHLGDYIYEYANGTFGDGEAIGRQPFPNRETVSLTDYRQRHAQYKSDIHLQECHRQHPAFCVWDDHEFTNDAWRGGAENHQPDEGDWFVRKARALRAYFEWMPIRQTSRVLRADNIFRSFKFGQLADLSLLETRVSARDQQLPPVLNILTGELLVPPEQIPGILAQAFDPARELLGRGQREWLFNELSTSQSLGTTWRVLGQQTMVGQLSPALAPGAPQLPLNLDQWDGYAAERQRLLEHLAGNGIGNVVICTGDIHSSWAQDVSFNPYDPAFYDPATGAGALAAEFIAPGITSEGVPDVAPPGQPRPDEPGGTADQLLFAQPHLRYLNLTKRGYFILDLTESAAQADWYHVRDVRDPVSAEDFAAGFKTENGLTRVIDAGGEALAALERPLAPDLDAGQRWMLA